LILLITFARVCYSTFAVFIIQIAGVLFQRFSEVSKMPIFGNNVPTNYARGTIKVSKDADFRQFI